MASDGVFVGYGVTLANKKMHKTIPALRSFRQNRPLLRYGGGVSWRTSGLGAEMACDFRR